MISSFIFKQVRLGKHGKPFIIYKFKTMKDAKSGNSNSLSDEERITYFGRFLRRFGLDELPQFLNIIKGDMALVGPRPMITEYKDVLMRQCPERFLVKPGITGWAQVHGRNNLPWNKKMEHDRWYVENKSLWLDLKIIILTFKQLLLGSIEENSEVQPPLVSSDFNTDNS